MIVKADQTHSKILASMAMKVWNNNLIEELEKEFDEFAADLNMETFIKYIGEDPVGFANCSLRFDYVEGCETYPVGYLEGIYVNPDHHYRGIGRELLKVCESWAKSKGCVEFASDCELDNKASEAFHKAVGFKEVNRIIVFRKNIYKRIKE